MKISINILNYNTYNKTKACIDSCIDQKDIEYRIVLIDNNSSDDSYVRLKNEYEGQIEFLQLKDNYGYAKGNNLGIQYCLAQGIEYSLILNSDITLVGDYLLKNLIEIINNWKDCVVVAPYIYNVTEQKLVLNPNDSAYLRMLRKYNILPENKVMLKGLCSISEAQGSALLVDNQYFINIGGFPEHYFMYGEEGTFAKKVLWDNKMILWYMDKKNYVLHHHDKSKKIANWRLYLMGRNRTIEYLENRKKKFWRWNLIFNAFVIKYFFERHCHCDAYLRGVQAARKMIKEKRTLEEIYLDGKNSKKIYGE